MKLKVLQIDRNKFPKQAKEALFYDGMDSADRHGKVREWLASGAYEHVANVEVNCPDRTYANEKAFVILNRFSLRDEAKIERLRKLHSLSVGDILEYPDGEKFITDSIGFNRVEEK